MHCDGQVLVYHDLLQYGSDSAPRKFVKAYANVGETIRAGIGEYVKEVKARTFPAQENTFHMDNDVVQYLYGDKE
ncbi:3-methyl-2-oxobutanoate hydroxymethyltransferase [compost metagenome]